MPDGLPGRPWFKHAIYAPGLTTGYACLAAARVRQALEENKPDRLKPMAAETAATIDRAVAAPAKVLEKIKAVP